MEQKDFIEESARMVNEIEYKYSPQEKRDKGKSVPDKASIGEIVEMINGVIFELYYANDKDVVFTGKENISEEYKKYLQRTLRKIIARIGYYE